MILSITLINLTNTVFADAYSDCVAQYSSESNTTQCDEYQLQYQDCVEQINQSVKSICGTDQTCISTQSTYYLKTCDEFKTLEQECLNANSKLVDQMCGNLKDDIPDKESTTKAPSIPKIDTLPGPQATDVSEVSPYLMSNFLPRIARTVISFGIGAAVLGLVLSSIGLLTAYGNEEKYGNAKKGMYFSLIGLVIALLAFAIVQLVFFTGFQIGNIT